MNTDYFRFVKNLLIYTLIIALIFSVISNTWNTNYINENILYLIFFFYALNILVFYFLAKAIHKDFNKFFRYFSITTTAKLMIYLLIIALYILLGLPDKISFTINFMILYIMFTVYEVIAINNYNKKIAKKE
jgi:cobalamin synthase